MPDIFDRFDNAFALLNKPMSDRSRIYVAGVTRAAMREIIDLRAQLATAKYIASLPPVIHHDDSNGYRMQSLTWQGLFDMRTART